MIWTKQLWHDGVRGAYEAVLHLRILLLPSVEHESDLGTISLPLIHLFTAHSKKSIDHGSMHRYLFDFRHESFPFPTNYERQYETGQGAHDRATQDNRETRVIFTLFRNFCVIYSAAAFLRQWSTDNWTAEMLWAVSTSINILHTKLTPNPFLSTDNNKPERNPRTGLFAYKNTPFALRFARGQILQLTYGWACRISIAYSLIVNKKIKAWNRTQIRLCLIQYKNLEVSFSQSRCPLCHNFSLDSIASSSSAPFRG